MAPSSTPGQPVPGSSCTLETSHPHPRLSSFKLEPSRMGVGQRTKPLPSAPGRWGPPSRLPAQPVPLCVLQCFPSLVIVILEVVLVSVLPVFFPIVSTEFLRCRKRQMPSEVWSPKVSPLHALTPRNPEMGEQWGGGGKAGNLSLPHQSTPGICRHPSCLLQGDTR